MVANITQAAKSKEGIEAAKELPATPGESSEEKMKNYLGSLSAGDARKAFGAIAVILKAKRDNGELPPAKNNISKAAQAKRVARGGVKKEPKAVTPTKVAKAKKVVDYKGF
jgi:replication-associated recombination protein RarA